MCSTLRNLRRAAIAALFVFVAVLGPAHRASGATAPMIFVHAVSPGAIVITFLHAVSVGEDS